MIEAAISMTLCEISTAKQHSVPMECMPFWTDVGNVVQRAELTPSCVEYVLSPLELSYNDLFYFSEHCREVPSTGLVILAICAIFVRVKPSI